MSIINDALKKTQTNMDPKETKDVSKIYEKLHPPASTPPPRPASPSGSKQPEPPKQPVKKSQAPAILAIVCILCVVTGVLVAALFFSKQKSSELSKKFTNTFFKPKAPKPAPARVYRPGEIVLNGTMMMSDHRVALINDKIFEIGDVIDGRELLDVSFNKITLKDQDTGELITLHVHNNPLLKDEKPRDN